MYGESSDPRLLNSKGILMLLGAHIRHFIAAVGFSNIYEGHDVATTREYLAQRSTEEIECRLFGMETMFWNYDFRSGQVYALSDGCC